MTKYQQIYSSGEKGDCFRTALGCLLDVHPRKIPNFGHRNRWNTIKIYLEVFVFLMNKYGICLIVDEPKKYKGFYIGIRAVGKDSSHAVIYKDGVQYHDVAPKGMRRRYGKLLNCIRLSKIN